MKATTVLTVGCFDMLHEGHAHLFRECGKRGAVVAAAHSDKAIWHLKGRFPVQTLSQRIRNVLDTGLVEKCYEIEGTDPSEWVRWIVSVRKDCIFMRGNDMPVFPGLKTVEELGIPIVLIERVGNFSSTNRRNECA